MNNKQLFAKVWEEEITIPTYGIGAPEKNPMFFENRVYQGSSGKVYPLPIIEKIMDQKQDVRYRAVMLENDYLHVTILPSLGGRIYRAYDKIIDYDFVYYNKVIKPALVGLAGPWISGGIEFNWPQHHRPTTFMPVEYVLRNNVDGSASVLLSEVDRMYGTKGMCIISLYPGKAYIEIQGQLYNPTSLAQTFLWWANPAVAAHDDTQSIFPPDVHFVMDHGKRDMSSFPVATGVYYKYDYSPGTDISRYKNIPVPTSFMAYHSDYDFIGGYDYQKKAGILHVADHQVSPGKKQWTWGSGDFGKAWDRNLTDDDGPYVELMTGIYTDNQPDFSWLMPGEEKTFKQYFMPYREVGQVTNANKDFVLGLQFQEKSVRASVYASSLHEEHTILVMNGDEVLHSQQLNLLPEKPWVKEIYFSGEASDHIVLQVVNKDGEIIISNKSTHSTKEIPAKIATALPMPSEIASNEELYLAGIHLEQYRHATRVSDGYYLEALKRDPGDIRCNTAYGMLLLRRGQFKASKEYFQAAIERLTWKNPNPYDSEAFYGLGLACYYESKLSIAYEHFFKAAWSANQQEASYYFLASISAREGKHRKALEFAELALVRNSHNMKARAMKALMLRNIGDMSAMRDLCEETLRIDPFCHVCRMLLSEYGIKSILGDNRRVINTASWLLEAGCADDAVSLLLQQQSTDAVLLYHRAWALFVAKKPYKQALLEASSGSLEYAFPNTLEDMIVLQFALAENPDDGTAAYCLGNLMYDKKRYEEASALWRISSIQMPTFATPLRNLAIYAFNKLKQPELALKKMQEAFNRNDRDARVLMELDQLRKRCAVQPAQRLSYLESRMQLVESRDDLLCEYITLLNLTAQHDRALEYLTSHRFHPWEGGEGKIVSQYKHALVQLASKKMKLEEWQSAESLLRRALVYPENLGEGKLIGTKDNDIYFLIGKVQALSGRKSESVDNWVKASVCNVSFAGKQYYYDQPAEMAYYAALAKRCLGDEPGARQLFMALEQYGCDHVNDTPVLDYFAVSLPDMQVFDEDLILRNREHCLFLSGLGALGLRQTKRASELFNKVLETNPAHYGAIQHLWSIKEEID